ncbi:hypothetical protein TanjilG_26774 [Lupinus angustifolius]|uniref:Uncharacterized protein n=1 Tax=Lupinus angustifolius TaxID=3871 RepID=A0A1J7H9T6_LUPAN|nr:hypothetical protein TanjilG_26774 [Lupinus angustifolius]
MDVVAKAEDLIALRKELESLRLSNGVGSSDKDGGDIKPSERAQGCQGLLKSKEAFPEALGQQRGARGK